MKRRCSAATALPFLPLLLPLAAAGCASPADGASTDECRALREEVRELRSRLDRLDGGDLPAGGDLLARFPPPEWGEERLRKILTREVTTGVYRNEEEGEFIERWTEWKSAFDRRRAMAPAPGR